MAYLKEGGLPLKESQNVIHGAAQVMTLFLEVLFLFDLILITFTKTKKTPYVSCKN